jgi:hypothetical protein
MHTHASRTTSARLDALSARLESMSRHQYRSHRCLSLMICKHFPFYARLSMLNITAALIAVHIISNIGIPTRIETHCGRTSGATSLWIKSIRRACMIVLRVRTKQIASRHRRGMCEERRELLTRELIRVDIQSQQMVCRSLAERCGNSACTTLADVT